MKPEQEATAVSVSFPRDFLRRAKVRAAHAEMTFSAYVAKLIQMDLARNLLRIRK